MMNQRAGCWIIGIGFLTLAGCLSANQFAGEPTPAQPAAIAPPENPTPSPEEPTPAAPLNSTPTTPPPETVAANSQASGAAEAEAVNCTNPQTQVAMNTCAAKAADAADAHLNEAYQKLRATLQPREDELLVTAQLAWIQFRDTNCAFSKERFEAGSIAPMVYSSCIERLTKQRTQELEGYAQGFEDGGLF